MLIPNEPACCRPLHDGLVLRTARDEGDVARVAEFNAVIHGPGVGPMVANLFLHHPDTSGRDLIFVENNAGQIVSSLCLIPWQWRYEDAVISAGEQGMVGTLEPYRRLGLIRTQIDFFKSRLQERGCLLSPIQGIPYFYRQFGYEYALPLEGGLKLETRQIPAPFGPPHTFRQATLEDLPVLMALYDQAAQDLTLRAARSESVWRYLLACTGGTESECENWIIERGDGSAAGYIRLPAHHFGDELAVNEVSSLDFTAATCVLDFLKGLVGERRTPGIRLNLPANSTLMRLARSLGAHDLGTYAWQIHIPDVAALLRTLAPVFARRIASSPFAGLTHELRLCFYRETLALRFTDGRLAEVCNLGFCGNGEINLNPLAFVPLVLGYRDLDELRASYPDVSVAGRWRLLMDTLFPKVPAFIYTIY